MKKGIKILSLIGALSAGLFLGACGNSSNTTATPSSSSDGGFIPIVESSSSNAVTYDEVSDVPLETGTYMKNNEVYDFNKETKKLIITKYEDYDSYKNNSGVKQLETTVQFIDFNGNNAVYFQNGEKEFFIYKGTNNSFRLREKKGILSSEVGFFPTSTIVDFAYGTYVSTEQVKYKLDNEGKPIDDPVTGGYVKENFYVFFELTETTAKIFISDNATTHGDEAFHSVSNYKYLLINSHVYLKIPHANNDYECTLYTKSATEIHFSDATESRHDYEYTRSGDMTKIA